MSILSNLYYVDTYYVVCYTEATSFLFLLAPVFLPFQSIKQNLKQYEGQIENRNLLHAQKNIESQ